MKKILIFDDDTDILEIIHLVLTEQNWDVITRPNCHNILEVLAEHNPDVILMDNWIPETGGVAATRLIKSDARFAHIPVIYFSANDDVAKLAEEAGADRWLAKPFDLEELEAVIK